MNLLARSKRPLSGTMKFILSLCLVSSGVLFMPSAPSLDRESKLQLAVHLAGAAPLDDSVASASLRHFAAETIQKLAQHPPFLSWVDAPTSIEPLGPGTRSWLVTVFGSSSNDHSASSVPVQIGYLIISADSQGMYKLIEYGAGPDSLYSENAATDSRLGSDSSRIFTPVYGGPLLTAWRVTGGSSTRTIAENTEYLDALSGEALPETDKTWSIQSEKYTLPSGAYGSDNASALLPGNVTAAGEYFDPYDNILWMAAEDKPLTSQHILTALDHKHNLVFAASGKDRTYRFPLPIYGYQTWNAASASDGAATSKSATSAIYVQTGHGDGASSRWISLDAISEGGSFHQLP